MHCGVPVGWEVKKGHVSCELHDLGVANGVWGGAGTHGLPLVVVPGTLHLTSMVLEEISCSSKGASYQSHSAP